MALSYSLTSTLARCVANTALCDDTGSKAIFIIFAVLILGGVVWRLLNGPERR